MQYFCKKQRYYRTSKYVRELINTLCRYDSRRKIKNKDRKLLKIGIEKIAKIQNISENELSQVKKLQRK